MEVFALASGVRTTPRKARLVAATVVGLPVQQALTLLAFTPRAAAVDVAKVIKSAAANAEHNYELDLDSLRVKSIEVNGGRTIKRFRPRAQGRAFSIMKRTVHMRAVVTDEGGPIERPVARRRAAAATPAPRRTTRARAAAPEAATTLAGEAEITTETTTPRTRRSATTAGGRATPKAAAKPKGEAATGKKSSAKAKPAEPQTEATTPEAEAEE
jgi:large subunit ribosomal protein L22